MMSRTFLHAVVLSACLALPITAQRKDSGQTRRRRPAASPCAVADPAYARIARETGGQAQTFDHSEAAHATAMLEAYLKGHEQGVLLAEGTLAQAPQDFIVPVDATVESIVFSVFLDCKLNVAIEQPSGALLVATDAGVEDHSLRTGRIVTVDHPSSGFWRIRISGRGHFSARADAKSPLFITGAEFVELSGRPGHEAYFPVQKLPRFGVPEMLDVRLSGRVTSVRLKFVSIGGEPLQTFSLPQVESSDDAKEFFGPVTLNFQSFRVVVEGEDSHGLPYQRLYARLFRTRPANQ